MSETLSYLSFVDARRLAREHMPRLPDESVERYGHRLDLQAEKLLAIASQRLATDAAGLPTSRSVFGEGC